MTRGDSKDWIPAYAGMTIGQKREKGPPDRWRVFFCALLAVDRIQSFPGAAGIMENLKKSENQDIGALELPWKSLQRHNNANEKTTWQKVGH